MSEDFNDWQQRQRIQQELKVRSHRACPTCDGTGTNAVMVIANRRAYGLATQVGATIETVWDPESLQYKVIGYQRVDFQPWFAAATQPAVSVGYNIDVS